MGSNLVAENALVVATPRLVIADKLDIRIIRLTQV